MIVTITVTKNPIFAFKAAPSNIYVCVHLFVFLNINILSLTKKKEKPIGRLKETSRQYACRAEELGKTPAEACGIMIEGQDKWRTLIENAAKNQIHGLKEL
jgi:hypothetical protein